MVSRLLDELVGFKIIEDTEVMQEVITIIKEAREHIVLVSPYNSYHINLKHPIEAAAQKVAITAVCREDQKGKEDPHLKWLSNEIGADVYLVERLHAKIYYNESTAIITSMNLSESSANNSKEIGIRIKDGTKIREIRRYVNEGLIKHGTQVAARPKSPAAPQQAQRPTSARAPRKSIESGSCIRCKAEIPLNPDAPHCAKCERSWKRYANPDYPEKHCHRCGKERKTSFAKPLCPSCQRATASAT